VVTQVIGVSEGRRVAVDCWGDPKGFPVFLLHGTPGSRKGPVPRAPLLYQLGVRLVCYDRPGYGGSDRHKGRSVTDAAWDVLAIADHLGLDEFGVVGRSGGGPHALACAALIEETRLRNVAVLVSLAPSDATGLDWFEGMTNSNIDDYELASRNDSDAVVADLAQRAEQIQQDPESLLDVLEKEMADADLRIVTDVAIRRQLAATYKEALKDGAHGWIDDVLAFRRPWGFDLEKIAVPVRLWHGEADVFSPAEHSRWLAKRIPRAQIEVQPGAAHFGALEVLPRLLAQMKADSVAVGAEAAVRSERLGVEGPQEPALSA
jgi:pimeloyl-ACP methyl ester carboxylesterase